MVKLIFVLKGTWERAPAVARTNHARPTDRSGLHLHTSALRISGDHRPITMRKIYLDHHATTPVDPRVADRILHVFLNAFGNANSVSHSFGEEAASLIREARECVSTLLGASPSSVHFTSGSTESIRLALLHALSDRVKPDRPLRIAVSAVEHHAVLDAVREAEISGQAQLTWIPVDSAARVVWGALEKACAEGAELVCVMAANNEVGTVYPVQRIARLANQFGARTLVDATQAAGWADLQAHAWGITYLAVSAHKIYGPKGVGALVTHPNVRIAGTNPETGTRAGTPNVPGLVGLGEACRLRSLEMEADKRRLCHLRDQLQDLLQTGVSEIVVNGDISHRLPHNLHVSVPGLPNDAVVMRLRARVAISTGAACSSGALEPSHVLRAMGLPEPLQEGALRISPGKFTTDAEIEEGGALILDAVRDTQKQMRP